jgi:hypothetical protein
MKDPFVIMYTALYLFFSVVVSGPWIQHSTFWSKGPDPSTHAFSHVT